MCSNVMETWERLCAHVALRVPALPAALPCSPSERLNTVCSGRRARREPAGRCCIGGRALLRNGARPRRPFSSHAAHLPALVSGLSVTFCPSAWKPHRGCPANDPSVSLNALHAHVRPVNGKTLGDNPWHMLDRWRQPERGAESVLPPS